MGRSLQAATPPVKKITEIVPIEKGGTGGYSPVTAAANLGALSETQLGKPNGPAQLGPDGLIPVSLFPKATVTGVTVKAPKDVFVSKTAEFFITNYDAKTSYTVSADRGSVTRTGAVITVTAPDTIGPVVITVNGKRLTYNAASLSPVTPSILSPINGSVDRGAVVELVSSTFTMPGSAIGKHQLTDWQIATDIDFNNIVNSSIGDTYNMTNVILGNLSVTTSYYARVRHRDSYSAYSGWSDPVMFTTSKSFSNFVEKAKLVASDRAAGDYFGYAVDACSDGSRIVVSSVYADVGAVDTGAVYVFVRTGSTWVQEAKLIASDKAANDNFGNNVAIDATGTRIAIGAPAVDSGAVNTGAAYVFVRSGSTWTQEAKLVASDRVANDSIGHRVSITSDASRIAISAAFADAGAADTGAAYIFVRNGSVWTQEAKLVASDKAAGDNFGTTAVISAKGERVVIGAAYADVGATDNGAVYVFIRNGSIWTQEAKLVASDKAAGDQFGNTLSMDETCTRIAISSHLSDVGAIDTGAVYVFVRNGSVWTQEAKLTALDRATGDIFSGHHGSTISPDGSRIAVGAHPADVGAIDTGAVYIFVRNGTVWTQESKLVASDKAAGDYFGTSPCFTKEGTTLLVGACSQDSGGVVNSGAVYEFSVN